MVLRGPSHASVRVMRLHHHWRALLRWSWSIRLMALSAVLSGVVTTLTIAQPYLGVSPLLLAGLIGVIATASSLVGIFARLIPQTEIQNAERDNGNHQ